MGHLKRCCTSLLFSPVALLWLLTAGTNAYAGDAVVFQVEPREVSTIVAIPDTSAPVTEKKVIPKLNLNLQQITAENEQTTDQENNLLLDKNQQLIDNLSASATDLSASNTPTLEDNIGQQNSQDSLSIGGSVMTEKNSLNETAPLTLGKGYIDSIDGAKIDLKVDF